MGTEGENTDRRFYPRISIRLKCFITFDSVTYEGVVENVSRYGMRFFSKPFLFNLLTVNDNIRVKCLLPSGKEVDLGCDIRWLLSHEDQLSMGVEIKEPPPAYMEFVLENE